MDFRPYITSKGWTLRSIWKKVGGVEAHFHRVISGKAPMTPEMAGKIEAAVEGYLPAGFLLGVKPFTLPTQDPPPSESSDSQAIA